MDWDKLVEATGDTDLDIRLADRVLRKLGIAYNQVEAFVEDSEEGGWKLAVS